MVPEPLRVTTFAVVPATRFAVPAVAVTLPTVAPLRTFNREPLPLAVRRPVTVPATPLMFTTELFSDVTVPVTVAPTFNVLLFRAEMSRV